MAQVPTLPAWSPATQRTAAAAAMLLAVFAAIAGWAWWVSFDNPEIIPRAHDVMWDVVSYSMERQGRPAAEPVGDFGNNLLVQFAVDALMKFGPRYASIVAVQLPLMILLIVASGLLAWRLGGPLAAGLGSWLTALAPMTVGLAVQLDDLLAYQALATTALALLAWSDARRKWWLALLAPIPVGLAIEVTIWFSTELVFLAIFASGAGGLALARWGTWWIRKKEGEASGLQDTPWALTLGAASAFAVGIYHTLPIRFDYLLEQATHPDYQKMNAWTDSAYLWGYPRVWFWLHAGPCLAVLALAAILLVFWGRRRADALPYLTWLALPMIVFSLINKRLDFYLVAISPATYGLAALGVAALPRPTLRPLAAAAAILAAAGGWVAAVTTDIQDYETGKLAEVLEGRPSPYLFSPYARKNNDYNRLGELVAETCGPVKLPVLFVSEADIDQREAFHTWRANPDLTIYDLKRKPFPKPERACLILYFDDPSNGKPMTLDRGIEEIRRRMEARYLLNDKLKRGMMMVEANRDNYRFAGGLAHWGLFVPVPDATMNPADPLNRFPLEEG